MKRRRVEAILAAILLGAGLFAHAAAEEPEETLWDALLAVGSSQSGSDAPDSATPHQHVGGVVPRNSSFRVLNDVQGWLKNLGAKTRSDLKITGQHNLRYHMETISGSRDSYENGTYYGRPGMGGYTDTDVTISGKIFGLVSFETRYTDSLYGQPYENRIKLSYATKAFSLEAGDIQAGITGNSLLDFSRSLRGFTMSTSVLNGVKLSTLYTQEKAQTRTIVINGANRSGPYYVFAGQVVDGSAKVRVNNRDMVLGQDYTLDPYTGELNFLNGIIVYEMDTIAVTFETYGYDQSPGVLSGWRADITAMKPMRVGMTYLSQTSSARSASVSTRTEQFYGYNSSASPYVLELPVEVTLIRDSEGKITGCTPVHPMTVTVSGMPQVYGTDYVLDPLLPNRVYFKMAIPSTQIIKITYTPVYSDSNTGDRSVFGFDLNTSIGKIGTLTAEYARSSLSLSSQDASAGAWQIRSDMKFAKDKLHLNWTLRNIGTDFTAIQSPGFRRNDRGFNVTADYQPNTKLKVNATLERSRRPAYSYSTSLTGSSSGLATTSGLDDYNQLSLRANWQIGKNSTLSLNHDDMQTTLGAGGRSKNLTDTLTYQQTMGQLSLDASVGRQNASTSATYYQSTTTSDSSVANYGSDAFNSRLSARWRLGERLSFDTAFTNSSMRSADGKRNTAQDISFNTRAMPMKNLTVTLGYQYQTSGGYSQFSTYSSGTQTTTLSTRQVGTVGYIGSNLTGYYGGGVNSGLGSYGNYSGSFGSGTYGLGSASFGGNSRGVNLTVNYQPRPNLTLDVSYIAGSSVGDYLFNSKRSGVSFNATYNPGERLSLFGGAMFQNVSYVGSDGGTNTSTLYFNAQARPLGKLVTMFNFNLMRSDTRADSSSASTTTGSTSGISSGYYGSGYGSYFGSGSTNLTSYGLRLEYPVWTASNVFLQWDNADSTGYLASIQSTLSFGLAFDLGNNTQFQVGLRDQRYRSKGTTSTTTGTSDYSYHVRSIDADLGLRF